MSIELFDIANAGLLVLIWMVQLIIYPSFVRMNEENLLDWHPQYSRRISLIVIPLMFLQLGLIIFLSVTRGNLIHYISLVLIILVWLSTFLQAVPLHNKIASQKEIQSSAEKLVKVNWIRTTLWTIVFFLELFF